MKKAIILLAVTLIIFSCKNKNGAPDVSGIKVNIELERFDRSFFAVDTLQLQTSLQRLQQDYPGFYKDFMQQILGVSGSDSDRNTQLVTKEFLNGYTPIYDSIKSKFNDLGWLRKELEKGFQFVKYYFPEYKAGKAILFLGPFDAPGVASTTTGLAIGLQQFAGSNFFAYKMQEMQEMFPVYISRRFSPEYITANCMKAVELDLFPDQSTGKPLIEQMVEKGKQWYLLDKFLPFTPDTIKTGYTKKQLSWCEENEGLIWAEIVRNEDLNSINPTVIQTYIGESPFTQGFSPEYSPGNIGQWIGWQIIKKFVDKHPEMKPEEVMRTPPRKILDEAKYKPR